MDRRGTVAGITLLLLAVAIAAPAAGQVISRPIPGDFAKMYFFNGRIVDSEGWPVNQAFVRIEVTGLKGVTVEPFTVGTNCHGDFSGYINVGTLEGRPRVRATFLQPESPPDGFTEVSVEEPMDKLFRETNFVMKLPFGWPSECQSARSYWETRMTVWGRVVQGAEAYEREGATVYAKPVQYWPVDMLAFPDGGGAQPPDRPIPTDERGDFKYSWTFADPVHGGNISVGVRKNANETSPAEFEDTGIAAEYDAFARVAFVKLNVGITPRLDTPAPPAALAFAAVAVAAVVLALTRGRKA